MHMKCRFSGVSIWQAMDRRMKFPPIVNYSISASKEEEISYESR